MFVRPIVQGFESSVNKVFKKEQLVNSKTNKYTVLIEELVQQELTWFMVHRAGTIFKKLKNKYLIGHHLK